jgi:hypothetical protein
MIVIVTVTEIYADNVGAERGCDAFQRFRCPVAFHGHGKRPGTGFLWLASEALVIVTTHEFSEDSYGGRQASAIFFQLLDSRFQFI